MMHYLFAGFLRSAMEYDQAKGFWSRILDEVAAQAGQRGKWKSWQTNTFHDGTAVPRDGNPIFEARSEELSRAVRIIQYPPEEGQAEFAAWIETFPYSESDPSRTTEELVFNVILSEEVSRIVRRLLATWMDWSVSRERMEDILLSVEIP